jgi:nitroreductase
MDALDVIQSRRSIRSFARDGVDADDLRRILQAGQAAPSAGNARPWEFVVVDDADKLARIPDINPYARMAPQAPLGILVCGNATREKFAGYWVQDCSAACQNILLAAHALGYGGVWTGIHPMQDRVNGFRELFGLPDEVTPLAFIPLGRPKESKPPNDRFEEDRVHANGWQG